VPVHRDFRTVDSFLDFIPSHCSAIYPQILKSANFARNINHVASFHAYQ
jgi:hypothetical protein